MQALLLELGSWQDRAVGAPPRRGRRARPAQSSPCLFTTSSLKRPPARPVPVSLSLSLSIARALSRRLPLHRLPMAPRMSSGRLAGACALLSPALRQSVAWCDLFGRATRAEKPKPHYNLPTTCIQATSPALFPANPSLWII